jgi:Helix-turn-helix domain
MDEIKRLLGEYLTEDNLARELNRTPRTIKRWRAERTGPAATFIGNSVFYHKDSVREWLRSQERKLPPQRKHEEPRRKPRSRAPRQSLSAMS